MSLNHNPSVVTNGLALYYDMSNTQKSWKGAPVTNLFPVPVPAPDTSVTFPNQGEGGFYRVSSGNYGGYDISPTDVVYRYNLTNNLGCHYHGVISWPVTVGQPYTFSFDYYADLSVTGYPNTNFLANFEGGLSGSATDPTPTIRGVWKRMSFTSTASSATANFLLYPGACGGYLGTGGFILYKNPQVELNSFSTPFVDGTRSNTQAILDLTKSNTLTAASLTYASDNTFSFNGSNNYIDVGNTTLISGNNPYTISAWFNSVSSGGAAIFGNYGSGYTANTIWVFAGGLYFSGSYYITDYSSRIAGKHNICVTRDSAGAIRVYFDGVLDLSASNTNAVATNQNYRIGADVNGAGEPFNGSIYVVQVYNRALSATEVSQNFNALRSRYGI